VGYFKELAIQKMESPELTTKQKSAMVESLEQVKEDCWKDNVLSVIMFVSYKDGSQGEFCNGLVNPESTYAQLSKTGHRLLTEAIAWEDETNV
tara:strand:+ start:1064 stop:1342 length:279 start_codon:yes stop_codon:yes gene_type:complete